MRGVIRHQKQRRYARRVLRLETIPEHEEFRDGPYPSDTLYEVVAEWIEELFSCWFEGHKCVCVRRV